MAKSFEKYTETKCREEFTQYLLNWFSNNEIIWDKLKPEDEPPDYYLKLSNNLKFSVEVTESKIYLNTVLDNKQVSEKGYLKYHYKFINEIKNEALKLGILNGLYEIEIEYPIMKNKKYKKFLSKLKAEYFQFIKQTKYFNKTNSKYIYDQNIIISTIKKHHSYHSDLCFTPGSKFAWTESIENKEYVKKLLQNAINDKKKKLYKKKLYPIILLYYDSYGLVTKNTYNFDPNRLKNINFFHTIYIYTQTVPGFLFYTINKNIFK